jgi:hypothetical protein
MLQIIMHHNGDLFIRTPEKDHPLYKNLKLNIGKGEPDFDNNAMLYAISEDLLSVVLWFFDLHLEELVDYEYAPHQSKFALGLMRNKLLSEIESMIRDGVTGTLTSYDIQGFMFLDTEQPNQ